MRSKGVVVAAILATSGVAVWAAGGRASIEETARMVLARAAGGARDEVRAKAVSTNFTELGIINSAGQIVVAMAPDMVGDGAIVWGDHTGGPTAAKGILLVSEQNAGQVAVFNTAGTPKFILDGNSGLLSAPGDMAEMFPASAAEIPPGSVVVIDPGNPGALVAASKPYDRRVAGVVSGAKDYNPGITLRANDRAGQVPVTLTGTVYCLATAVNGAIRAGDLLTTSAVPGHAMRATDPEASRGAVLGKALEDLASDRGFIMVLASLQ